MRREDEDRLDAKEIAALDEETMPEVKRPSARSPGTGGDPEHHDKLVPNESNDLTT